MSTVDLKITNGKLVIPGVGIVEGGIAVDDGKIVAIGKARAKMFLQISFLIFASFLRRFSFPS